MNLFEIIHDAFEPFMDDEKKPLNVMEVTNLWFFLLGTETTMRNEEIGYNLAQDEELKLILKDVKENLHIPIKKEIAEFLKKKGVPLPQSTPEKPTFEYQKIPEGAKLNDEEIANLMQSQQQPNATGNEENVAKPKGNATPLAEKSEPNVSA